MSALSGRAYIYIAAQFLLFILSSHVIAHCGCESNCSCPKCQMRELPMEGRWHVVETENFRVCCDESESRAESLARHTETLRTELRAKWLGESGNLPWSPKCKIVLHRNLGSYVSAVGRGSERTVGSSLVRVDGQRIASRRIDLLGGDTNFLATALPHELAHVVVRDKFVTTGMPRWADEGLAILEDPAAKQGRHAKDLQKALDEGTSFRAGVLLALDNYPTIARFGTFYGESASITSFLVKRKSPSEFVAFMQQAEVKGYDAALKKCYGIENVRDLDQQWRATAGTMRFADARR